MQWIKPLSYILLFLILMGVIYGFFYWSNFHAEKRKNNLTNSQERADANWNARLEHARLLTYRHQYDEAENIFRTLLNLRPDSIAVKVDLASLLYYQGKDQEALDLLNQIPAEQRDHQVKLLIADIQLSLKHYAEAQAIYQEYLKYFPYDRDVQLKLAQLLAWQKKYEESLALYQDLLAQEPDNLQIRRHYALVLIWMGKYEQGMEELKKTLPEEKAKPSQS
jgi:thioredoxin-like negative regulator of GroEL